MVDRCEGITHWARNESEGVHCAIRKFGVGGLPSNISLNGGNKGYQLKFTYLYQLSAWGGGAWKGLEERGRSSEQGIFTKAKDCLAKKGGRLKEGKSERLLGVGN